MSSNAIKMLLPKYHAVRVSLKALLEFQSCFPRNTNAQYTSSSCGKYLASNMYTNWKCLKNV